MPSSILASRPSTAESEGVEMNKTKTKAAKKAKARVRRTRGQEMWHQFKKNKGAMVGLVVFAIVVLIAIYAQFAYAYTTAD